MTINPIYLKDAVTAEIILEILISEPGKRLDIVNKYLRPAKEDWQLRLHYEFFNAAMEAYLFMDGKPAYAWLNDDERGYDLLERVTGYRP